MIAVGVSQEQRPAMVEAEALNRVQGGSRDPQTQTDTDRKNAQGDAVNFRTV